MAYKLNSKLDKWKTKPKKGLFGAREDGKSEKAILDQIKQARQEIRRAPILALKERWVEFKKQPTVSSAFGVFFSVIGVRAISDWKIARANFKPLLRNATSLFLEELKMDPKFRADVKALSDKGLKWLTFDRHGNLILTSYSGNPIRKPKLDPLDETLTKRKGFMLNGRADVEKLLKQAKEYPQATIGRESLSLVHYDSKKLVLVNSKTKKQEVLNSKEIQSKRIIDVEKKPELKKLILVINGKTVEILLDKKKAEGLFKFFSA